jgi:hypothetical protein
MAEMTEIMFEHKEVVELLIKKQGLHEGIWGISFRFGMKAANFGTTPDASDALPTALVGVLQIGIHREEKETNLSLDAAKVNPRQAESAETLKRRTRH